MKRTAAVLALATGLVCQPAAAQTLNLEHAQDLTSCAGAIAASQGLDLAEHYPGRAAAAHADLWSAVLADLLVRVSQKPGLEGITGLDATRAARSYWASQPRAAQQARADACRQAWPGS